MTFLEFKNAVARYVKTNTADNVQMQLIADAINIAIYDLAREKKLDELLKVRVELTIDNAGTPAQLPLDFMEVERFRFYEHVSGKTWKLSPRTGLVPPAPVFGYPTVYQLVQDSVTPNRQDVIYEPFTPIVVPDKLFVDYYAAPARFTLDADEPITLTWDSEIIKRASHYVLTYQNKVEQAKQLWATKLEAMDQSAAQAQSQ